MHGDNLQAADRMKLAASFVFFRRRDGAVNFAEIISMQSSCIRSDLPAISTLGISMLFI